MTLVLQQKMTHDISFGFNIPVFAGALKEKPEESHYNIPKYGELSWQTTREGILKAEELGFDSVWAADHLLLGNNHAEYECWTLLSMIAGMTENIRIGSLVLCNEFRNPALLAKMGATLDVVSNGRLELGLGAGWNQAELENYGWKFRDGFERLMRLDESIRLIKEMWTEGVATFDGERYQTKNAYCEPKPIQNPHPPILVGGTGEQITLKLVAKHADIWNAPIMRGHPDNLRRKMSVINDHCDSVGRDYEHIEKSWESLVLCTRDETKREQMIDLLFPIIQTQGKNKEWNVPTRDELDEYLIIGSPERCVEAIERRVNLGITKFQLWFVDYPDFSGMELFADEVIPQFR